jgi:hypothetical protein
MCVDCNQELSVSEQCISPGWECGFEEEKNKPARKLIYSKPRVCAWRKKVPSFFWDQRKEEKKKPLIPKLYFME